MHLTLLGRAYCSLCDTMAAVVAPVAARHGATLEVVDVDAHPAWAERYGDLVPVLFLGDPDGGHELCHYHADPALIDGALASRPALAQVAREREIR